MGFGRDGSTGAGESGGATAMPPGDRTDRPHGRAERAFERLLFLSRWLLAPFYVGLIAAVCGLLVVFAREMIHLFPLVWGMSEGQAILAILSLVDMALVANLLLMVIFAGYENFVSRLVPRDHEDRPAWLDTVDFSGLKLKLVAAIVAISAIQLLKAFIAPDGFDNDRIKWMLAIHLVFVIGGVLLALMDKLAHPPASNH